MPDTKTYTWKAEEVGYEYNPHLPGVRTTTAHGTVTAASEREAIRQIEKNIRAKGGEPNGRITLRETR